MITANELISLMYTPMTDNKMIEIIDVMGLEQPIITEEYEENKKVSISNKNIALVFKEITGYSEDGNPALVKIDFINHDFIGFPYNLLPTDNYILTCEKLKQKADYKNKRRLQESKIWVKSINKFDTSIVIHFTNQIFKNINYIIINKFDTSRVGKNLIPNQD